MRIVFMGTPGFAVASLEALMESNHKVAAVVTAPDRPAGRGRKLQQPEVKRFAEELGLPVLQPLKLKDPEFLKQLNEYSPDLIVVVAFRMLPREVWAMPPRGTINLHASLLPQYRGAAPINWAIINDEKKTGATTFFINEKIDTGAILMQKEVLIEETDTAGILHDKLMLAGADLLVKTIDKLEADTLVAQKQQAAENLRQAPKIFREDTHIDFNQGVLKVYNLIRGLSPYPGAYATLENNSQRLNCKILEVSYEQAAVNQEAGTVISDNQKTMKVACPDGWIELQKIQLEGKKAMKVKELLNGFEVKKGAKFL